MRWRSRPRHTVCNWLSLSELLEPICLKGPSLIPASRVRYRIAPRLGAKWAAERIIEWPHYRDVTPCENSKQTGTPVVWDELFPRLWKVFGTVAALTLGFLLGILARVL
jgi:hypothetical protein